MAAEGWGTDGIRIFRHVVVPTDAYPAHVGRGDDEVNGGFENGKFFTCTNDGHADGKTETLTFRFNRWLYLLGGQGQALNAQTKTGVGQGGDYVRYVPKAPATPSTSNPGAGAYSKLAIGGGVSMFVPAGTPGAGAADFDLNLSEKFNANVDFTKVVPVSAPLDDGFFDWDCDTDVVTLNSSKAGGYNLFDSEIVLRPYLQTFNIIGDTRWDLTVPAIMPARILPHWKHDFELHVHSDRAGNPVEAVFNMFVGLPV